ncbi:MAG: hypothetical protein HQL56_03225 [Magnetococcales bacterium]|nr:hypothetical protein [Magnetococcales bacterium]
MNAILEGACWPDTGRAGDWECFEPTAPVRIVANQEMRQFEARNDARIAAAEAMAIRERAGMGCGARPAHAGRKSGLPEPCCPEGPKGLSGLLWPRRHEGALHLPQNEKWCRPAPREARLDAGWPGGITRSLTGDSWELWLE